MVTAIRVLLVDDEQLVCTYLSTILQQSEDIVVVDVQLDGAGAVEAAVRLRPDVVLMDLRMPGVGGIAAIKRIRQLNLPTQIIALTAFDDEASVLSAMRAGADGFVLKSTSPSDLVNVIRVAAQGQTVLSAEAARRLVEAGAEDTEAARARELIGMLTGRESEVLMQLAEGRSNAEIGAVLGLTEATVKGYVSRVLSKLGCGNRTQAGLLAHTARLR